MVSVGHYNPFTQCFKNSRDTNKDYWFLMGRDTTSLYGLTEI